MYVILYRLLQGPGRSEWQVFAGPTLESAGVARLVVEYLMEIHKGKSMQFNVALVIMEKDR